MANSEDHVQQLASCMRMWMHWSITSLVTSFVTKKVLVMLYEASNAV